MSFLQFFPYIFMFQNLRSQYPKKYNELIISKVEFHKLQLHVYNNGLVYKRTPMLGSACFIGKKSCTLPNKDKHCPIPYKCIINKLNFMMIDGHIKILIAIVNSRLYDLVSLLTLHILFRFSVYRFCFVSSCFVSSSLLSTMSFLHVRYMYFIGKKSCTLPNKDKHCPIPYKCIINKLNFMMIDGHIKILIKKCQQIRRNNSLFTK
jgi:hypothetical protein